MTLMTFTLTVEFVKMRTLVWSWKIMVELLWFRLSILEIKMREDSVFK